MITKLLPFQHLPLTSTDTVGKMAIDSWSTIAVNHTDSGPQSKAICKVNIEYAATEISGLESYMIVLNCLVKRTLYKII